MNINLIEVTYIMNMTEYQNVKDMTYIEYCDYLQDKYGISPVDYINKNCNKNGKVTRTKFGLFVHHKMEDHAILLSTPVVIKERPIEWQYRENLVYCDFLEHLLLHILITEYPSENRIENEMVGSGGIVFITKNLNDFWTIECLPDKAVGLSMLEWQQNCFDYVKGDIDVYFELHKRYRFSLDNLKYINDSDIDKIKNKLISNSVNISALKEYNEMVLDKLFDRLYRHDSTLTVSDYDSYWDMSYNQKLKMADKLRPQYSVKKSEVKCNKNQVTKKNNNTKRTVIKHDINKNVICGNGYHINTNVQIKKRKNYYVYCILFVIAIVIIYMILS